MKILLASDHAGPELKSGLIEFFKSDFGQAIDEIIDLGTSDPKESVDYPDYAIKLCNKFLELEKENQLLGILICGSGIGISIAANKFMGIRAALCRSTEDGRLSKEHNNANIICLGARNTSLAEAKEIILAWKKASFQGGRHSKRLDIMAKLGCNPKFL
ncbi:MAG: ribose 5-phosphate isomerase B [Oligoflexia bacterium]|nr:ribose 5-phosphate isomerase B [Oligoflexia bacterium]